MLTFLDVIAKHDVEDALSDATPQEVSVCLLITNTLKEFIPVKAKYNILAYQLYFCIFDNDVLQYAGYSITRKLCPSTSISNINTLHLDAPSLYQILNQKSDSYQDQNQDDESTEPIIYGYNKEPISSIEIARRNKDAVFHSVFDMNMVHETCESYHLIFGQRISLLPGLKSVRILGIKKTTVPSTELIKKLSYTERILQNPNIIREGQKSLENLKSEEANLNQEVKLLKVESEKILGSQKERDYSRKLKILRKDCSKTFDKAAL